MKQSVLSAFSDLRKQNRKGIAILLDPDKVRMETLWQLVERAEGLGVDFFFVGGSLLHNSQIHEVVPVLKAQTSLPVVLFPGGVFQISPAADALLFLSLISGRNPELLIGKHVEAAPLLKETELEVISTGYMLVESGKLTTANYISNTLPIPYDKPGVAACTALAGEYLGMKLLYLDGGSGAARPVPANMVQAVQQQTSLPLIVGGGIRSAQDAERIWTAGADVIVVGNALERDPAGTLLKEMADAKQAWLRV